MRSATLLTSVLLTALFTFSAFTTQAADAAKKSLYDRLGGKPAIAAVVDDFVNTAAGDPKVNFFRDGKHKDLNVPHLKAEIANFVGMATGGPEKYKGAPMKKAHRGMKITSDEFDAIAADLAGSLDKFKVPQAEKDELMAIVGTTKKDIVEVK